MVEYWESKTDDDQILDSVPCHPYKNKSHSAKPIIPILQYSIIPTPPNGNCSLAKIQNFAKHISKYF